jgi:hypothetical protein
MHIGNFGPLAFRKDFNLNVSSNVGGWYRRYIWQANLIPTGIAHVIDGKLFDCGPDQQVDINQLLWESEFVRYGVAKYKVQLVATINPNGSTYTTEGAVIVLNQGIIWHWTYQQDRFNRPGFRVETFPQTDFWSPDWWDVEPQGRSIFTISKLWTDGPPH